MTNPEQRRIALERRDDHELRAQLLWSLKDAYQRATGEQIQVTDLLMQPTRFDAFLQAASVHADPEVRNLALRMFAGDTTNGAAKRNLPIPSGTIPSAAPPVMPSDSVNPLAPQRLASPTAAGAAQLPSSTLESFQRVAVIAAAAVVMLAGAAFILRGRESAEAPQAPAAAVAVAAPQPAAAAVVAPKVAFRVHGSNTVGEHLTPALVAAFLRSRGAVAAAPAAGATPQESLVRASGDGFDALAVEVHAHGSSTAFSDLQKRATDIGQSSRRIKPAEIESLKSFYGDLSSPAAEHVIALDGLAIVVNPANPLRALTTAEVASVFSGAVTDWRQLGGEPSPIHVVARDDKSGTWDTFKSLVLEPQKVTLAQDAQRFESSSELVAAVGNDPHAIGFVSLSFVRGVKPLAIAEHTGGLALLPTPFTVATEDYPLSRRLYFYAPATAETPMVRDFVEFAVGPEGQRVVDSVGFVALEVRAEQPTLEPSLPTTYRELATGAERLSVNFRFESGSDRLDTKAIRDLDRTIRYLQTHSGKRVQLFGFADSSGTAFANRSLSERRARVVEQEFIARGVAPHTVHAFGAEIPIASNDTEHGRIKNRRVEVWIR